MMIHILTLIHGAILLGYGILLSMSFSGIKLTKHNLINAFVLFMLCGFMQLVVIISFGEDIVRKLYPIITHIPLLFFIYIKYRKTLPTSLISVMIAYLTCQLVKWFGVLTYALTQNIVIEYITRIILLILLAMIIIRYLSISISNIINRDDLSVLIVGIIPIVYYLFDYATGVYTNLWTSNNPVIHEFFPFLLSIVFLIFCIVYYKEYEQKIYAERKEQFLRISIEHQTKEIETVRQADSTIRLLRHDMRFFLNTLVAYIHDDEKDKAVDMIRSYSDYIDETKVEHFCSNSIINYVLSSYSERFKALHIDFTYTINIDELLVDEILFASILSNALDNALNAQKELDEHNRNIRMMLKVVDEKLLLSIKNPFNHPIEFVDGLPISHKQGHGFGTQSIRYLSERLGGNCQFSVQDHIFTVRVII